MDTNLIESNNSDLAGNVNEILKEFKARSCNYTAYHNHMKQAIDNCLLNSSVRIESINSRIKSEKSLIEKLSRPNKKKYLSIDEITDIIGFRIIVYHQEDVYKMEEIIRQNFDVDDEQSIDAVDKLAPNEFDYLSLHLIARILNKNITDYLKLNAEIQIRTVLQHAWASISHALQYKHEDETPDALKRRLYRLSAILELADTEFDLLNNDHKELLKSDDQNNANIIMILRKALGTSLHSFDWIRSHTPIKLTDEQFDDLIIKNSNLLQSKRVTSRDKQGNRILPGKPGLKFIQNNNN